MALSTSTDSLAVGASRTFNLSPGSALTLVAPPNVRATITETPNTVSASGVGGNASRVHNLQLGQTVTYGPYPMGGTVVVANASNSGTAITWVRSDSIVAESASGAVSLVSGDGNVFPIGARVPILNGASAGTDSGWLPLSANPERFVYQLDSGTTTTTFSVDISADGVTSLGQAFTGTWAASASAEITFPLMFSNPLAKFFRWNVVSGGPLSVSRGA
jgi:hypothetical protein